MRVCVCVCVSAGVSVVDNKGYLPVHCLMRQFLEQRLGYIEKGTREGEGGGEVLEGDNLNGGQGGREEECHLWEKVSVLLTSYPAGNFMLNEVLYM